jgi:hypothetical protein
MSYSIGLNQMAGMTPWNYGNYYLGNTTMQMMPFMMNQVQQYGFMSGMGAFGNASMFNSMFPCCTPISYSMPMMAPMMAAATPLPVAFNPLVQGMYPMASTSPVNWMAPSSFMSALTTGPMPYRPPAYDFPSNVGMVMAIPYGTPNPLLSSSAFGSVNFMSNVGSMPTYCCCYSMPPMSTSATPMISYYPHANNTRNIHPITFSQSTPASNFQHVSGSSMVVPSQPPLMSSLDNALPMQINSSLISSQSNAGQSSVLAFKQFPSKSNAQFYDQTDQGSNHVMPIYNATNRLSSSIGHRLTSRSANTPVTTHRRSMITSSKAKYNIGSNQTHESFSKRFRRYGHALHHSIYNPIDSLHRNDPILPPILYGELISDSGWLPKTSINVAMPFIESRRKGHRTFHTSDTGKSTYHSHSSHISFLPHRRRNHRRRHQHHSPSSASEYDCTICEQERGKHRLRKYFGSSNISPLLSMPKKNDRQRRPSSSETFRSSKSHRHHKKKHTKQEQPVETKPSSSGLLRQPTIAQKSKHETIQEMDEDKHVDNVSTHSKSELEKDKDKHMNIVATHNEDELEKDDDDDDEDEEGDEEDDKDEDEDEDEDEDDEDEEESVEEEEEDKKLNNGKFSTPRKSMAHTSLISLESIEE